MGEQEYYNSKDLLAYKPEFYYGCTSKPRNITKKKIPKEGICQSPYFFDKPKCRGYSGDWIDYKYV
jgi:hypothetical protein